MKIIRCQNYREKRQGNYLLPNQKCGKLLLIIDENTEKTEIVMRCTGCRSYVDIKVDEGRFYISDVSKSDIDFESMLKSENLIQPEIKNIRFEFA